MSRAHLQSSQGDRLPFGCAGRSTGSFTAFCRFVFFFVFVGPAGDRFGCQHLTDLIISVPHSPVQALHSPDCWILCTWPRRSCVPPVGIPHASCPIVMRKYGICDTIKCASHLCYTNIRLRCQWSGAQVEAECWSWTFNPFMPKTVGG